MLARYLCHAKVEQHSLTFLCIVISGNLSNLGISVQNIVRPQRLRNCKIETKVFFKT